MSTRIVDTFSNEAPTTYATAFLAFIDTFSSGSDFPYKTSLTRASLSGTPFIIQISDLPANLLDHLIKNPTSAYQQFQSAISVPLHLVSNAISGLRFNTKAVNTLIRIRGIVLSVSHPVVKPTLLTLICKKCLKHVESVSIPRTCDKDCGLDPFYVDCEKSKVIDEQRVRVQELFEDVGPGEMPRHITCVFEGMFVDSVLPGENVTITGIVQMRNATHKSKFSQVNKMVLSVTGLETSQKHTFFTEKEQNIFNNFARENVLQKLLHLFAPQIHGNEMIKTAILCVLFGGRRKEKLGVRLRGDVNVLLLGDPGTAKSQLLKYASMLASGVYTSGKGSSAAGLTASVLKNKRGEFYLEGGALVLSDNGLCCIDEFDKMDENDRVSIHEAMEQQTISINKAGINVVLNTRCAVLAAANPIDGRYDGSKTVSENIEFSAAIMSRFDCIFVIRDLDNIEKDKSLARHVIDVNEQTGTEKILTEGFSADNIDFLRKYISYAKLKCSPLLSDAAKERLGSFYIKTRQGSNQGKIKITIRQLESLIRLSECFAKMELSPIVELKHVEEGIRLFKASTLEAVADCDNGQVLGERILKKMVIGEEINVNEIKNEKTKEIEKAVKYLERAGRIKVRGNSNILIRLN